MRAVAFAVAFAAVDTKNQFLASDAPEHQVQDVPNAVKDLSQEIVQTADVDGNQVVSSVELNQGIDATKEAVQEGLTTATKAAQDLAENVQKMLGAQNFEQFGQGMPNFSKEEIQKKLAEIKDSKLKKQLEDMAGGLFAQVDKNGDSKIDGEEVVKPFAQMLQQFSGVAGDMLKQVQENLAPALSDIAQQVKTGLAKVDKNQDGSIDSDEVAATINESIVEASMQDDEDVDEDEELENEEDDDEEDDE